MLAPLWSAFSLAVLLFLGLAVICAPLAVNGAAYLAGAGTTATFTPTSHGHSCDDKGNCSIVTDGWAATLPVQSDWSAVGNLTGGLFGFLAGVLLSFLIVLRAIGGRWWLYLTRRKLA